VYFVRHQYADDLGKSAPPRGTRAAKQTNAQPPIPSATIMPEPPEQDVSYRISKSSALLAAAARAPKRQQPEADDQ